MEKMLQQEKEVEGAKPEIKLNDLIKILQALEKICEVSSSENAQIVSFIKELRYALRPHKSVSGYEFLDLIRNPSFWESSTLRRKKKKNKEVRPRLTTIMSFDEIRELLSKGTMSKEQLLNIAEKQFGLSKGTLQKLKKEEIRNKIESAIQNIETLKAIQRKAVE